ncbi:uncharacterized protein BP5553_05752 [Venustampulla echinocandica]|uniref:Uncharacterized protein n=1 Tax=Venustampulla echinocandica TaxID=2656787 RepID=A0A370TLJ2_9HELO|nr:uncharacterized protein BP5553_05752 [Venustampulla echinocandica]RDL36400.1 hypothetical protein BP5553_05752 [Venustampulla echinocandica]
MAYPTPPPTSSPKDEVNRCHNQNCFDVPSQVPAQEPYCPPPHHIPAQESYFPSYSGPNSPTSFYAPPGPPPNLNPQSNPVYYSSVPPKRRTPPPRPLYFSPTNKPPSPYNTGRPKPRPGFLERVALKLAAWIQSFIRWGKENPIKAGLATFIPVLLSAGVVRAAKGLSGPLKKVLGFFLEGMGGGKAKGVEKKLAKGAKKEFGWGLDHFVGFGGTKSGPVDGIMKVLQMYT